MLQRGTRPQVRGSPSPFTPPRNLDLIALYSSSCARNFCTAIREWRSSVREIQSDYTDLHCKQNHDANRTGQNGKRAEGRHRCGSSMVHATLACRIISLVYKWRDTNAEYEVGLVCLLCRLYKTVVLETGFRPLVVQPTRTAISNQDGMRHCLASAWKTLCMK